MSQSSSLFKAEITVLLVACFLDMFFHALGNGLGMPLVFVVVGCVNIAVAGCGRMSGWVCVVHPAPSCKLCSLTLVHRFRIYGFLPTSGEAV
jgi:hypothetical protein